MQPEAGCPVRYHLEPAVGDIPPARRRRRSGAQQGASSTEQIADYVAVEPGVRVRRLHAMEASVAAWLEDRHVDLLPSQDRSGRRQAVGPHEKVLCDGVDVAETPLQRAVDEE